MENKIQLIAPIITDEDRLKEVAAILGLPEEKKRQADLQYFTAIFVSSGGNLNHAYFLPSELLKAKDSIPQKAVDLEHMEREVVGHIYDNAFVVMDTMESINPKDALKDPEVDSINIHSLIAGVVYSGRFPEVAQEIKMGRWKVSMECYYDSFDIKIGDLIIPQKEAESLGYAEFVGKPVIVKLRGEEVCSDLMYRVLRGILFTGCGFVHSPANPPSIILEYAALKKQAEEQNLIVELENIESYMKAKQEDESLTIELSNRREDEDMDKKSKAAPIRWQCNVCGGILSAEIPPTECPMCNAKDTQWKTVPNEQDNNPDVFDKTKSVAATIRWICTVCGTIINAEEPPTECPGCPDVMDQKWESYDEERDNPDQMDTTKYGDATSNNLTKDYDDVSGPGVCVSYKKEVYDKEGEGGAPTPDSKIVHVEWCNLFITGCTTTPKGKATEANCLRWKAAEHIRMQANKKMNIKELLNLNGKIGRINDIIRNYHDNAGIEESEKWTREYINKLPDGAFAIVEPGYPSKSQDKNARHLPHHTCNGGTSNKCLDMSHLRNAFARANQIKAVIPGNSDSALRKKAVSHLDKHKGALKTSK